ncbi:hypothetical protein TWF696_007104 [Orbilia brochopaga]|uniref:Swiss Army Knife RNA repair protein HAD domain-containing protein n=1 Tax=Orbilia brochopaga TaxID=3140254 RepID=A0AAV9UXH9_9PEZI
MLAIWKLGQSMPRRSLSPRQTRSSRYALLTSTTHCINHRPRVTYGTAHQSAFLGIRIIYWEETPSILDATIAPDDSGAQTNSDTILAHSFPDRWNEQMMNVARKAIEEPRTLSVLLTGRSRKLFSKTILKILENGGLNFDMVVLKQAHPSLGTRFPTTMGFKTGFLTSLLKKYHQATKISIYDDRPYHFRQFKEFGEDFNRNLRDHSTSRSRIKFDCQYVAETHKNLNVLEEIKQVKFMLRRHNKLAQSLDFVQEPPPARLLKRVSKTGYMLSPQTTSGLLERFPARPQRGYINTELFGTCVPIKSGKCDPRELEALGGIGSRVGFETVSYGSYDDCIWAVRVRPTSPDAIISTADETPTVLLSKRAYVPDYYVNRIDNWEDVSPDDPRYLKFTAIIGEQLRLQISVTRIYPSETMVDTKNIYRAAQAILPRSVEK